MPKLQTSALAKHWGTTTGYVRQLRMRDGSDPKRPKLPEFEDLGDEHPERFAQADAWRAQWAPPRERRIQPVNTDPPDGPEGGKAGGGTGAATVDVSRFLVPVPGGDFEGWAIHEAEDMLKIAIGLHKEACGRGNQVEIANAIKNVSEAARRCKQMREDFAKLRERSRETINIDRASDLVGRAMNTFVKLATGMGARIAAQANPADPALAQRVIDGDIDRIFAAVDEVLVALEGERASAEPRVA